MRMSHVFLDGAWTAFKASCWYANHLQLKTCMHYPVRMFRYIGINSNGG